MFGTGENSGIVGILVGVMMLVFAGIFFSLLVDKRFSFSSGKASLQAEIAEQADALKALERQVEKTRALWAQNHVPLLGQGDQLASLKRNVAGHAAKFAELQTRKENLLTEIGDIEERFAAYRNNYRRQVRGEAAGEDLGSLQTRSGKVFSGATIREVNAVGMVIRHEEGLSRLSPAELDASWNERFQWDAEEAEAQRRHEQERMQAHLRSLERPVAEEKPKRALQPVASTRADPREIEALRQEVLMARTRLQAAESQAANARSEARSSRGQSVPGSLETWAQRADRLDGAAVKLRAQYIAARGKLAAVAPRDPALHEVPGQ